MTPELFLTRIVNPGLFFLRRAGGPKPTDAVRHMLITIALQESGPDLNARYQGSPSSSPGPARGWWQFEQGGGVAGVLAHFSTEVLSKEVCNRCSVQPDSPAVWRALEGHDLLATSFARMLLFTDPAAIPTAPAPSWEMYMRLWRPGKPHPETWGKNWQTAATVL